MRDDRLHRSTSERPPGKDDPAPVCLAICSGDALTADKVLEKCADVAGVLGHQFCCFGRGCMNEAREMGALLWGVEKRLGIVASVYKEDASVELCYEWDELFKDG